jgi:hypothetical protein
MPISTVSQKGLDAPLSLTAPNLGTPSAINLSNATALPSAALPAGCVLQVVSAVFTATTGTTSTSFVSTVTTASITPKSATNKIYIMASGPSFSLGASYAITTLYRNNTTNLGSGGFSGLGITGNNPGTYDTSVAFNYLDSPTTTSATTYTVYLRTNSSAAAYWGDVGAVPTTITLMEIAA